MVFLWGCQKQKKVQKVIDKSIRTYVREGSPAMSALMNRWSFGGIEMLLSRTR